MLAGSYISVYVPPDSLWIASLFGLAFPVFLIFNILFIIFWIFFKPRYLIISLVTVIAGWGFISRYIRLESDTTGSEGVKILSYNVKNFDFKGKGEAKKTADSITSFLKSKAPDIICLQEMRLRSNHLFNLSQFVRESDFVDHYQYARTAYFGGIVTMTRYPIINMGEIRFENSGNMAIFTDVIIDEDTIRIFNVHLQSYQIDPEKYTVIESPGITEESDLRQIREMGSKFKRAFIMRAGQARIISENINWSPYPVLICGDFNDTPVSYTYRKVRGGLKDAFVESGKGMGRTYVGKLPSFRIDYIFHSGQFDSYYFNPEKIYFSDHLPVSCLLVKK